MNEEQEQPTGVSVDDLASETARFIAAAIQESNPGKEVSVVLAVSLDSEAGLGMSYVGHETEFATRRIDDLMGAAEKGIRKARQTRRLVSMGPVD
jgi:hypothetical protein